MTVIVPRQRAQTVHDWARARAGLPYDFGGAFTLDPRDSTDCSGLVLQTGARYIGRDDWPGNRYGSTESFRLDHKIVYDLGFKRMPAGGPAALPFKPVMLVGLQHGGGGENSHTACTLMTMDIPGGPVKMSDRGVDWESHGNVNGVGVDLYDGARAWNDRMFHDFWYLDAKLEDAPAGGAEDQVDVLVEATGLTPAKAAQILPQLRDGLIACQCTTPLRIAMALAQWGHESDNFEARQEYDTGANHGDPAETTDRWKYKGRTWIQITWSYNYADFSRWCFDRGLVDSPTYFVDRPHELADQKWAALGPAWYWTDQQPRINEYADRGDIENVSKFVNAPAWVGDPSKRANGMPDRIARYNRARALGDRLLALVENPTPADPLEELLMTELESLSAFATPGEPKIPASLMLQAADAVCHRILVLDDAELGDEDAIFRLVRASRGQGKYTDPTNVRKWKNALTRFIRSTAVLAAGGDPTARGILAHMQEKYPAELEEFVNRKGQ